MVFNLTLKRIFKEGVLVTFTDYLSFGVLFLVNVFINKYYGTLQVGIFTLIYTIAQITIMSMGSGFSAILRRDVSINHELSTSYIISILQIRALILIVSLLLVTAGCYFFLDEQRNFFYFLILMLGSKGIDLFNETIYTTYQSIHAVKTFAVIKSFNYVSLGVLALLCCYLKWPIYWLYEIHLLVASFFFILNFILFHLRHNPIWKGLGKRNILYKYLLNETWPLLLGGFFFQLSSRISILIIQVLNGTTLQGMYSICITIIIGLTAFSNSISIVLFPYLTRIYKKDSTRLLPVLNRIIFIFFCCSILLFFLFRSATPYILLHIGVLPAEAPELFNILSFSIIPIFLSAITGYIFTIMGKQYQGMVIAVIMLFINAALFYIFSLKFGIKGAAIAYILSQFASFIIMYGRAYSILKKSNLVLV